MDCLDARPGTRHTFGMPFTPLFLPEADPDRFPSSVPVVATPRGTARHGSETCPAVARKPLKIHETVRVHNGELRADVHCFGSGPEWLAFRRSDAARRVAQEANGHARNAWAGRADALDSLAALAHASPDPRVVKYAHAVVRGVWVSKGVDQQSMLVSTLKRSIAWSTFARGHACLVVDDMLRHAVTRMSTPGAYQGPVQEFRHAVRLWCAEGEHALQELAWALCGPGKTGPSLRLRGPHRLRLSPAECVRKLDSALNDYLVRAARGEQVHVDFSPTQCRSLAESAYTMLFAKPTRYGLEVTLPLPSVALLAKLDVLTGRTSALSKNGRALAPHDVVGLMHRSLQASVSA